MIPYLLKRLLVFAATLFGILVLVFALIRMAPGEPDPSVLGSEEPPSSATLDEDRYYDRLYRYRRRRRLDLPLVLNLRPLDRDAHATFHLERAVPSAEQAIGRRMQGLSRAALRVQGAAAIPVVLQALPADASVPREDSEFLLAWLRARGVDDAVSLAALEELRARWTGAELGRGLAAATRLVFDGEAATRDVHEYGSLLFAPLMRGLEQEHDPVRRDRALEVLRALGAPVVVEDAWKETDRWWRENGLMYRVVLPGERFAAFLGRTQFGRWIGPALSFEFGRDLRERSIADELLRRLAVSIPLMAIALIVAFSLSIPMGVWLATTRRRRGSRAVMAALYGFYSAPTFWLGLVLLALLAEPGPLGIFAPSWSTDAVPVGAGVFESLRLAVRRGLLPVLTLSLPPLAYLVRQMHAAMRAALAQDFIRTARAKGLRTPSVVWRHALRNSLLPMITILGGVLPALVGGSLVVESVFEIPGMGRYAYEGLLARDYNVIMAVTAISAVLTLVGLFLADVAYRWVDPRIGDERS